MTPRGWVWGVKALIKISQAFVQVEAEKNFFFLLCQEKFSVKVESRVKSCFLLRGFRNRRLLLKCAKNAFTSHKGANYACQRNNFCTTLKLNFEDTRVWNKSFDFLTRQRFSTLFRLPPEISNRLYDTATYFLTQRKGDQREKSKTFFHPFFLSFSFPFFLFVSRLNA